MARTQLKKTRSRRSFSEEFMQETVQTLLDGHSAPPFGTFNSASSDEVVDTLWGGAAADAFFGAPPDNAADRNVPVYGPDLN